jgi:long-chain acyl-CoA synthetase
METTSSTSASSSTSSVASKPSASTAGGSDVNHRPPSLARMFLDRVAETPEREAFRYPVGSTWKSLTWAETGARVRALAAGLLALGVQREQRIGVLASTRVEWILADTSILCAGAATTTVYPSTGAEDTAFILADSDSRILFAEDDTQIAKIRAQRAALPNLAKVVTFDGTADGDFVISLADLESLGADYLKSHPRAVDDAVAGITPEHLATLIYTSGTTGKPKGVRLTHDCWTYEGEAIRALGLLNIDDLQYLWLPLAHSFGKVLTAAQLAVGFASAIDGRIPKLVENLAVVQPTFMGAAPRIFEKVYNGVVSKAKEGGGLKYKIFTWAIGIGRKVSALRQAGKKPGAWLAARHAIANKLVYSKLKARFGGRVRFFISGSAALSRDIAEFFHATDVLILEGYGLTETSAASFVNRPDRYRFGTVGLPMPGTEIKIAGDGEILIKGPGVMRGYHNLPEATAEVLKSGWLATGDIGEIDADGFLRITDRKKDLIKTSGGKYVAPQAIEGRFKAVCPYVAQVIVHGDKRNFCSALLTLDEESIMKWAGEHLPGKSYAEVVAAEATVKMMQGYVDQVNEGLPRWETLKKFAILPRDLTVEEGDLTPSLKVKRKAVEKKYASLLDSLYAGALESD